MVYSRRQPIFPSTGPGSNWASPQGWGGSNVGANLFNQNRAYALLGWQVGHGGESSRNPGI
jgi:hypothetical protein